MNNVFKTFGASVSSYLKKGPFGAINNKSGFTNYYYENGGDEMEMDYDTMYMLSNVFITVIIIISIVLGYVAVNNICSDSTARGKNTRLGMYFLLLLSGGSIGWVYVLLWILKIDVCS